MSKLCDFELEHKITNAKDFKSRPVIQQVLDQARQSRNAVGLTMNKASNDKLSLTSAILDKVVRAYRISNIMIKTVGKDMTISLTCPSIELYDNYKEVTSMMAKAISSVRFSYINSMTLNVEMGLCDIWE